jgi:Dehydrogenases with different specificities (related to short-chain alcohol dehydrogenases)
MENKIALVTGGTSGIGKEIVKQLLENGATAIINYGHNEDQKNSTEREFSEYKDKIYFIKADIKKESEVQEMFELVLSNYGKLDYLVNNAGTNVDELIEDSNLETYMDVVQTNFIGKMLCIKHATPLLKNSESASIVNISSNLGVRVDTECSAYCCSATAIIKLTECAALELEKYNIRVNTVSPGFTPTPLSLAGWTKEQIDEKLSTNPRHRLGTVEDMANTVIFLLSDKADFINGENIKVNGGSILKRG